MAIARTARAALTKNSPVRNEAEMKATITQAEMERIVLISGAAAGQTC